MGFEPTTLSLARRCSTTEPLPPTNGFRPVVPRVGIEPTTRGFSVRCSTAELPRPKLHNTKEGRGQVSRYSSVLGTQGSAKALTAVDWQLLICYLPCTTPPIHFAGRVETAHKGGLCLCYEQQLKTYVYIDGLNLYYRAVRGTPFKWLNIQKLADNLFPGDEIRKVRYFTSLLNTRPGDPDQPRRQFVYLRALATLPRLKIHYGVFRSGIRWRQLAEPMEGLPGQVRVLHTEEKGTDVNLATRLLVDGFDKDYEQAVIISNDADFSGAMQYVRDGLGLRVIQVNPDRRYASPTRLKNRRHLYQTPMEKPPPTESIPGNAYRQCRGHQEARRLVSRDWPHPPTLL